MNPAGHVTLTCADDFNRLTEQARQPVLVDFWAPWCAPCRALMPVLENVCRELNGQVLLVKVNADELPALAQQFAVRSLPAVLLLKQGKVLDRFAGLVTEVQLKAFLDPYVEHEYDRLLQQASAVMAENPDAALAHLHEAFALAPAKGLVRARLADALMDRALTNDVESAASVEQTQQALQSVADLLAAAGAELQRDPDLIRAQSRLSLLQRSQTAGSEAELRARLACGESDAAITLALLLVSRDQAEEGLELLLALMAPDKVSGPLRERIRHTLIDLLNTVPDRALANQIRRRLFAVMH